MRSKLYCFAITLATPFFTMIALAQTAQALSTEVVDVTLETITPRRDTPSGFPVPRYVSLKAQETNCRRGPSFSHPIHVTYQKQGLPVIVVAETTDHWRKIQDLERDECWVHKSKLSGDKTAVVLQDRLALRRRPDEQAPVIATLGSGLIVSVEEATGPWIRIRTGRRHGWTRSERLWGAHPKD